VREEPFRVPVQGGELWGHRGGDGPPALLLHGGAAVTDYMDVCAVELDGLFRTVRYQQRGTYPSEARPPYTIEAHVADAVAVLDTLGIDRAWAIGHSWGGHLALHLAVSYPERLHGLICIDPLGAFSDVFADQEATMRRGLDSAVVARIEEIEERRRRREVTEDELLERMGYLWPRWFADPDRAAPNPVEHIGPRSSIETNASIAEHFVAGTLARELPAVRLPALFVHGELDPIPVRASTDTAALIPGSRVETIADCGHFPWLERPGELRRCVELFLES
jgi:pimeloyl-ACP methyl ester carboxylesterase